MNGFNDIESPLANLIYKLIAVAFEQHISCVFPVQPKLDMDSPVQALQQLLPTAMIERIRCITVTVD